MHFSVHRDIRTFLLLIASLCPATHVFAVDKDKIAAHLTIEGGKASPQGAMKDYLKPGNAYHLNIFGGAKVDMPYVGAVGLGWDFTYSEPVSYTHLIGKIPLH